jgi:hypothetical protein
VSANRFASTVATIWLLFTAAVYVPTVGRGFIKDDFGWVANGEQLASRPLSAFTTDAAGTFYRPLVALSFAGDYAVHQLNSRGYGFTNLVLYAACAASVFLLLVEIGLTPAGAAAGAFAWAVNPSGIDMAVLWVSGRTSLLMMWFSIAAVLLVLRNRPIAGSAALLCALLCKEDAVAVPLIILAVAAIAKPERPGRLIFRDAVLLAAAEAVYFALRWRSHAITPASAPDFYRLTWDPIAIAVNTAHYLDRAGTATLALALLVMLACRTRPQFDPADRGRLAVAAIWFGAGLAITVRVPVRSSLYAVFPSVAVATLFGAFVDAVRRGAAGTAAGDRRLLAALAAVLLFVPAYYVRYERWLGPAQVATTTMNLLLDDPSLPDHGTIVFEDEPDRYTTFANTFGGVETEALRLFTRRPLSAVVVPPGAREPVAGEVRRFRLVRGKVVAADANAMRSEGPPR